MPISSAECKAEVEAILKMNGVNLAEYDVNAMIEASCKWASAALAAEFIYRCISLSVRLKKIKQHDSDLSSEELNELERSHHRGSRSDFVNRLYEIRKKRKAPVDGISKPDIQGYRNRKTWEEMLREIEASGKLNNYCEEEIFSDLTILHRSVEEAFAHANELQPALQS